tara:strand:- start:282 stop:734 length:453 start_codon:yes stop_codon:yes gene_type:complete
MLFEVQRIYMDHCEDREIVFNQPLIKIKNEGIRHVFVNPFKYYVSKPPIICITIVKLQDGHYIMPHGIKCHPNTTLNDVKFIKEEVKDVKTIKKLKNTVVKTLSSKGDIEYTTTYYPKTNRYHCTCPGTWRSKGNCKHVKELRIKTEGGM